MAGNKTIGTLLFRIEADTKALRKGMSQTKRQISGLKKSFKGIAIAAAAAFSIGAVTNYAKEAVRLAGELEGVKDAFERIAPAGLLNELRDATKNTVANLDLMKRAVMAHNFQIPLQQLASLFAFATKRAQQTGESVDFLVNSIVIGIGRKSPLILDNLGISAVRLREELNNAGHSGATVFQVAEAVGKIAQKEMKSAGDIIETTTVKTAQLTAEMQNLKIEIGQKLTPVIHKAAGALSEFIGKVLLDNVQSGKDSAAGQLVEFRKQLKGLDEDARKTKIIEQIGTFRTLLQGFKIDLVELGEDKLTFWQQLWNPDFDIHVWKTREAVLESLISKYKELIRTYNDLLNTPPGGGRKVAEPGRTAPVKISTIGIEGIGAISPADVLTHLGNVAPSVAKNITESLARIAEGGKNLQRSFQGVRITVTKPMLELGLVVQQAFMSAVDAFGMFIESIAAGNMENAFNSILRVFGGFIVQMGKMIVAYGISMLAVQQAFANPVGAIAAGLALIAIGSAISGLASRGPSTGVSSSGAGGAGGISATQPVAVLRGADIHIAGQRGGVLIGGITG